MIKRGEVYWVNLDPTIGSEIRKTRPALVLSNDLNNVHAHTVTVLPFTTKERVYPFETLLAAGAFGNTEPCKVKADQIRTVDKRRLGRLIGALSRKLILQVEEAARLHLDLAAPARPVE